MILPPLHICVTVASRGGKDATVCYPHPTRRQDRGVHFLSCREYWPFTASPFLEVTLKEQNASPWLHPLPKDRPYPTTGRCWCNGRYPSFLLNNVEGPLQLKGPYRIVGQSWECTQVCHSPAWFFSYSVLCLLALQGLDALLAGHEQADVTGERDGWMRERSHI